jgi:hypothetical protein
MPSVQAKDASTAARLPRARPAPSVYRAPVPGISTMTSEVSQKVGVIS